MYSYYLPKYNQRIGVPSNFTIAMNGFNDGLNYTVLVTIENVEPYSGNNLVLQFTLTESHIPFSWYGLTEVNNVNRFMAPDQFGTPLDFSGSTTQTVMLEFTIDGSWVTDNCNFIAFVQDNSTKEILQGSLVALPDLMPMYFNNAGCLAVNMVPVTNCSGEVAPAVTITNQGATNLSTLEINYKVNDEAVNMYNWSGNLSYGETEVVDLPSTAFTVLAENNLMVYTTNPNGSGDEDPNNDTTYMAFNTAVDVVPNIYLFLKLDNNPEETSWELKNSMGDVLYSGDNYTQQLAFVKDTFELTQDDCYTFYIYDEAGNGLTDGGYFALRESNFNVIYQNNDFANYDESVQFSVDLVGVSEQNEENAFSVFPNPFTENTNVSFSLKQTTNVELKVFNMLGEVVYLMPEQDMGQGTYTKTFDASGLNRGIYFVSLKKDGEISTQKVTLRQSIDNTGDNGPINTALFIVNSIGRAFLLNVLIKVSFILRSRRSL